MSFVVVVCGCLLFCLVVCGLLCVCCRALFLAVCYLLRSIVRYSLLLFVVETCVRSVGCW